MNLRKIASTLAAVLVTSATLLGTGQAAYAFPPPSPGFDYEVLPPFFNTNAPKCLDVPHGDTNIGVRLVVFHCHGSDPNGANQLWFFLNRGTAQDPLYEIMSEKTNLCLNILLNTNGSPGTPALQNTCLSTATGLWRLSASPFSQYFALRNVRYPNMCLSTSNTSGADGTRVVIDTCDFENLNGTTWLRQTWGHT